MKQPILRLQTVSEGISTGESDMSWHYVLRSDDSAVLRSRKPVSSDETSRVASLQEQAEAGTAPEVPANAGPAGVVGGPILEAWKDIAAYLKRDVRTVQRWEKSLGLPVYRLQDSRSGSVFAYKRELDEWRDRRAVQIARDRLPVSPYAPAPVASSETLPRRSTVWLAALSGALVGATGSTLVFLAL